MTSKYNMIADMASMTAKDITQNSEHYIDFLTTAANNYKYTFKEQVLIYAQKPSATACAELQMWNKLNRRVNRGTKGIALLTEGNDSHKLRYVFDVSDTNSKDGTIIPLWQMRPQYEKAVSESLQATFGVLEEEMDFPHVLIEVAKNVAADNLSDYLSALNNVKENSLLENMDNQESALRMSDLLQKSVAFIALCRCGYNPSDFFAVQDFEHISNFDTEDVLFVFGDAARDISKMILKSLGETVKSLALNEKHNIPLLEINSNKAYTDDVNNIAKERRSENGTDLHPEGGLSVPEPSSTGETENREIRNVARNISYREQALGLFGYAGERDAESASGGSGRGGESHGRGYGREDESQVQRDRETESGRSNEVDRNDELHHSLGGGSGLQRTDLRIDSSTDKTEQKHIEEAEEEQTSAFAISQEDIDSVLLRGSGFVHGKYRIYKQYLKKDSSADNINFLKKEYGIGGAYPAVSNRNLNEDYDGKGIEISRGLSPSAAKIHLSWKKVEKRIGELIDADRYLSQQDKELYPEYHRQEDLRAARAEIADEFRSIVHEYTDLLEQLGEDNKKINLYYLSGCWGAFSIGNKKMHARTIEGDFILPMMREAMNAIIAENTHLTERCEKMLISLASDIAKPLEPSYDELNPPPEPEKKYRFSLGDTVYLGTQEYEVLSFDKNEVVLYDTTFPILNKIISRKEFDERLKENPLNDNLLHIIEEPTDLEVDLEAEREIDRHEAEFGADGTRVFREVEKTIEPIEEDILDEELDQYPISTVENGKVVTYSNVEVLLDKDNEEVTLAPPPAPAKKGKVTPHVLFPEIPSDQRSNYKINQDDIGEGTPLKRFNNNKSAIQLLKKLEEDHRLATPSEQSVLSQYVGWGGLSEFFKEDNPRYLELKELLTEDEYASARESTLTAFYTPPVVIKAVYKALENMNFKTGNVLEPSCGIGNFMGLIPGSMDSAKFYGVELDSISGRIAQQLYQNSSIAVQGFEETNLPDSFFDAAIGNVPFGQFKVSDKRYDKHNFLIHDYFFARTLDKVRPGGVIAFITSKGTMDKENPSVRKYIAQRADLLGAIRLPNTTFKAAAGTEVTSDIIFLQKRDRLIDIAPDWVYLATDENGIKMNSYFVDNPDMILGDMQMISGPYGKESACVSNDEEELSTQLDGAIQNIHAEISEYEAYDIEDEDDDYAIPADPNVRNFSFTIVDGKLYFRENSRMKLVEESATAESRIKGMIAIRDCTRTLIEYQTEDYPEADIKTQQEQLNLLYDDFVKKYGRINSRANNSAFSKDSSYPILSSLEELDDERNFIQKADMFSKRTIKQKVTITSVDTAMEAYALSLAEKANIDMPYMSQLTGKTEEELYKDLNGVIFLNPLHTGEDDGHHKYLPADEYLSGNVREKLAIARRSAEIYPDDYAENVRALEAVQPVDLTASEISVRLGATWIPTEIVEEFLFELFETPYYMQHRINVRFSPHSGAWEIEGKINDRSNINAYSTYGTDRMSGYKIMEETLNLKDVRVYDYPVDDNGNKKKILNKKETAIAQGKQELIKEAFADWIWKDPERRDRLTTMYNERFNSFRPREYDGSHMNFTGINPEITLRPHQLNGIAHILYGGNTLLAHVVGAGKTYEMTAAAMESKRLGLCNKSLFVVPNHLTEQWASEFLQLYPAANILVATKKDFETKNRKKFCGRIATGDYDAVIIGHSQFEKIPMSIERQRAILEQQLKEAIDGIAELKRSYGARFSIKQLESSKKTIKQKLDKLNDQSRKDDVVTFEELGVDRLFIDEAHYYKNLAVFTKMRNVGGIATTEAMKSSDLYMKCRYLDEITGNRGIVFATGTPISNSMVEMYTMQKYLQSDLLSKNDLTHFDSWASTFGETVTAIELAPEGTGYRSKTRFAKFYNLPELMALFKETADIQTAEMLDLDVPKANYHNIVLEPSETQKELVAGLSERAERVRNKMVDSSVDNMLLITNDGRKLALDQRLMNDMLPDSETSKVRACANNVFDIWQKTTEAQSTQMVFCDMSTPNGNGKFNVYDDLKQKLVDKGIPEEQIAYIHTANSEAKKKELFGKVRSGQVRVIIGSTQKMGAGTNVQRKLVALHHLDCPWRPSDLQQREGRIIRQGNENKEVNIFTYVTENTFDSYLYQLVEQKQKFIGQIMTSKSPVRSAEDIDETALSYAEIKALCAGNPHIKEKMDLDIEVSRLKLLKANHLSQHYALEDKIVKEFPQRIKSLEQRIKGYEADIEQVKSGTVPNEDGFSPMILHGKTIMDKKEAGEEILALCKTKTSPDPVAIGEYRGLKMELAFDTFGREYQITLLGQLRHTASLGNSIYGNIQRLDNAIGAFEERLAACKDQLENIHVQLENAKKEVNKPFEKDEELKNKTKRLAELNKLLDLGEDTDKDVSAEEIEIAEVASDGSHHSFDNPNSLTTNDMEDMADETLPLPEPVARDKESNIIPFDFKERGR